MHCNGFPEEHTKLAKFAKAMAQFWEETAAHHAAKAEQPLGQLPIPKKPTPPDGITIKVTYHAK